MYSLLTDLIFWLNSKILSFSDGIRIPQTSLFFIYVLKRFKIIFCYKRIKTIEVTKITIMFWCYSSWQCRQYFYCKIMAYFLFFTWNLYYNCLFFTNRINFWDISWTNFFFFNIQNIKSNCWIIFPKRFPIIYFWWIIYSFPVTYIYKRFNTWNSFWISLNFSII